MIYDYGLASTQVCNDRVYIKIVLRTLVLSVMIKKILECQPFLLYVMISHILSVMNFIARSCCKNISSAMSTHNLLPNT